MRVTYATVPRICPGGTVACLASGPSLTPQDVDAVRSVDAVIAINTTYQMAPWATALYAADHGWWQKHRGAPDFPGLKYSLSPAAATWGVRILRNTGPNGLERNPDGLRMGLNSGYQALGLAVHFGASRILLLGYDMQLGPKGESHWHGHHLNANRQPIRLERRTLQRYADAFKSIVQPLRDAGVEVLNCTRRTALTCFQRVPLEDALRMAA